MNEAKRLLPRLSKVAALYAVALFLAFLIVAISGDFSINNVSAFELLFTDLHTIRNTRPYAHWSPSGELLLFLTNPGFVVGFCVGIFQVRAWRDFWKGAMPLVVALIGFFIFALGIPGSALGIYAAAYQALSSVPHAIAGGFAGWAAWSIIQKERKQDMSRG